MNYEFCETQVLDQMSGYQRKLMCICMINNCDVFFPANQMEWWSPIMSLGSKISPLWWHEQCSGGTHSPASLRKSPLGQKQPSSHKSLQSPSGSDRARHVWLHTLPHTPYTWSSGQVSSAQTHTHTFGLLSWWRPSIDFCYVNLYAF